MSQQTELSVTATPGGVHSFTPKTEADVPSTITSAITDPITDSITDTITRGLSR